MIVTKTGQTSQLFNNCNAKKDPARPAAEGSKGFVSTVVGATVVGATVGPTVVGLSVEVGATVVGATVGVGTALTVSGLHVQPFTASQLVAL